MRGESGGEEVCWLRGGLLGFEEIDELGGFLGVGRNGLSVGMECWRLAKHGKK